MEGNDRKIEMGQLDAQRAQNVSSLLLNERLLFFSYIGLLSKTPETCSEKLVCKPGTADAVTEEVCEFFKICFEIFFSSNKTHSTNRTIGWLDDEQAWGQADDFDTFEASV